MDAAKISYEGGSYDEDRIGSASGSQGSRGRGRGQRPKVWGHPDMDDPKD